MMHFLLQVIHCMQQIYTVVLASYIPPVKRIVIMEYSNTARMAIYCTHSLASWLATAFVLQY